MTWDELVQQWWVQATSAIAATLAVAGIAAIFSAKVRAKFWSPIGHAIRWPLSLRLTTKKRMDALIRDARQLRADEALTKQRFEEVCELLDVRPIRSDSTIVRERIERLQEASGAAWEHAEQQIDATKALAARQIAEEARRGVELAKAEREAGKAEGRAEAEAEVAAQRAVPLLRPAWRIDPLGGADAYVLKNTQQGVDISNVSVDAPSSQFLFAGATQTQGPFDRHFEFYGQKTDGGRRLGVEFTVKWQDAHGEWWTQVVSIEREPRRAVIW